MHLPEWLRQLLTQPTTYAAIAALFSALAAFLSYGINRTSLSAKLSDRIYDLDKLIMGNADCFAAFVDQTSRQKPDYFTSTTREAKYYKLKVFAYYYLNLFDEIFAAYGSKCWRPRSWQAWEHYMFSRLGHPLIKELLLHEGRLKEQGGQLLRADDRPSVFTEGFIKFCCDNYHKWNRAPDPNTY